MGREGERERELGEERRNEGRKEAMTREWEGREGG